MAKYFTFLDRTLELRFFAEDPITVSIPMGDDMEQLLMEMGKNMDEAGDYGHAMEALYPILGRENTEKILSRSDRQDCYAAEQLAAFVIAAYGEGKEKNLRAAGAGRMDSTACGICQMPLKSTGNDIPSPRTSARGSGSGICAGGDSSPAPPP